MSGKKVLEWVKQWWLKAAWLAAAVAAVVFALLRCGGQEADDMAEVPAALTDSLQQVYAAGLQRVDYKGFRVYYNARWHMPACVAYELTLDESLGSLPRGKDWLVDDTVKGCAATSAFKGSGYDRGHMAPAGDMRWDTLAMKQSFMMTNICPQDHSLNEGDWNRLEEKVREWVQRDRALIVLCGPIVSRGDSLALGEDRVRVPGAFYKIVLAHRASPMRVAAFIYPNKAGERGLQDRAVTVREIERLTGLDFFKALPRDEQDRLETRINLNPWIN